MMACIVCEGDCSRHEILRGLYHAIGLQLRSLLRGKFGVRIRDWLVKSQRLNIAAKLAEWVKAFASTSAGIAHEVIEALFAGDDNKMRDAVPQADPHNDRIPASEVRVNELIR